MHNRLRDHSITLTDDDLKLRPMTENDWGILLQWNSDPEILHYVDERDISSYTLDETQMWYRAISNAPGYCFIAELDRVPVGECSIRVMDLDRLSRLFPTKDLRRIDLMIGEKHIWGKGIGTRMIHMLTRFGFEVEQADIIFGCDIAGYNIASRRAFEKNGYRLMQEVPQEPGSKASICWDMILTREDYMANIKHIRPKLH